MNVKLLQRVARKGMNVDKQNDQFLFFLFFFSPLPNLSLKINFNETQDRWVGKFCTFKTDSVIDNETKMEHRGNYRNLIENTRFVAEKLKREV